MGRILFFQDDDLLSDLLVLEAQWLTSSIGRVLDDDQTYKNYGILNHSELSRIWGEDDHGTPYPRHLYPAFIRLMERFLISFPLEDLPNQSKSSLIPLFLPHSPPSDMPVWSETLRDCPEIQMVYHFSRFIPPGIMSRLIVLTHSYTQGIHWRTGVRLHYEGHQAWIQLNESKNELWLRVRGPIPGNFFTILQHTISDHVFKRYFIVHDYDRSVPCKCHIQREVKEACTHRFHYERLLKRIEKGILTAECSKSFEKVSIPKLVEGTHYSSDNRIVAKLEENYQQLIQGQKEIKTITTQNQELITQNGQLFEQLNRSFLRLWNLQMKSLVAECPSTFYLMPSNRHRFHPKNLFSEEYTLYLLCQYPQLPHNIKGEKGYPVHQAKEWFTKVGPWLKHMMEYLSYIPKGAIIKSYDEAFFKDIEASIAIFDAVLKLEPKISLRTEQDILDSKSIFVRTETVEGPALRALYMYLLEVDKYKKWFGLHHTVTNDGNILWLCEEHRKELKSL